jgi:hypothetical protein
MCPANFAPAASVSRGMRIGDVKSNETRKQASENGEQNSGPIQYDRQLPHDEEAVNELEGLKASRWNLTALIRSKNNHSAQGKSDSLTSLLQGLDLESPNPFQTVWV